MTQITPQNRDSLIFYRSFYEAIKELPPTNQLEIYNAIFELGFNFQDTDLSGISGTVFKLIKPLIEANNKRFINGTKPKEKQKVSKNEAKRKQDISKSEGNKDKDKDKDVNKNDNVNDKIFDITKEEKPRLMNDRTWELFKEWWTLSRKQHKLANTKRAFDVQIKKMHLNIDVCNDNQYEIVEFSMNYNKDKTFQNICLPHKYQEKVDNVNELLNSMSEWMPKL